MVTLREQRRVWSISAGEWPSLRALAKRYRRLCRSLIFAMRVRHSPIRLPWFRFADESIPVNHLHCLAFRFDWKRRQTLSRRLSLVIAGILWPLKSVWLASTALRNNGSCVAREHAVSRWQQWKCLVRNANFYNLDPQLYYMFRMFADTGQERALQYFHFDELVVLLNELYGDGETELLSDKDRFYLQCQQRGLPTVPVIAKFSAGRCTRRQEGGAHSLPPCDLFLKWTNRWFGIGAQPWSYDETTRRWASGGLTLDEAELVDFCRQRSIRRPLILQPTMKNHPEMAVFSTGGLCTVRVVTFRRPGGPVETMMAALRMPTGNNCVDNFSAGGIAAAIDVHTGTLSAAVSKDVKLGEIERHPDTGSLIAGETVPGWGELRALAVRAHEAFDEPWSVGWDVALAPSGPLLIEANPVWGGDVVQVTTGRPLGETIFPAAYLEALSQKTDNPQSQVDHLMSIC